MAIDLDAMIKRIKADPPDQRLKLMITSLYARTVVHGSTLESGQAVDTMIALLDTYRLAVVTRTIELLFFENLKTEAQVTSMLNALGDHGTRVGIAYHSSVKEYGRLAPRAHLFLSAAIQAEKGKTQ